ncbi:UBX domain protein [Ancylostoma ceylanicum]|uniref:UBX domain-containing protein 4 n=1 Tax=Ancylostoma ceylanicum TaxID=53326 RepID=A0A0D6MD89_9BILA|nr:UBX domain protein [Ancylostoma ceylanicum]
MLNRMKWFAGSVSTAIQVSRKNNALFIVFIESKNAKGAKMSELWDKVEPSLFDCPFVGIHLMEGDEAAKQFSQIYPTPVLPASYIIDNLGKPIEIITLLKDIEYDEFFSKLSNAVKVFIANRKATTSNGPTQGTSGDQAPTTSAQAASSSSAELSLEEKVERAKKCRVQVRLPNGENIVEEFPSNDCLNTLTELIKQDGRVGGAFSIAQVYPRKVFTEEDMEKSFLELCLTPTCTLLVLQSRPKTSQIVAASPLGGIFSLFSMLFIAPLQYIYNDLMHQLGPRRDRMRRNVSVIHTHLEQLFAGAEMSRDCTTPMMTQTRKMRIGTEIPRNFCERYILN